MQGASTPVDYLPWSECRRPPRAIPRNLADAVVRPRCPGSLGAYGEVATNGWRVCGPRPWSSPSKGRTVGDTRLVAVISTRIGCGVSDATVRVGSRMTGDSAMFCTWPPMLSIAVSSGVLAAVVLVDDERVMPYLRDYAGQLPLARAGTAAVDSRGLAAQTSWRPRSGHRRRSSALNITVCQ